MMTQDEQVEFLKSQQKWHEAEAEKHRVQAEAYRQAWMAMGQWAKSSTGASL